MRPWIISEICQDLLGTRNGRHEILNGDPGVEYLVGILSPSNTEISSGDEVDADEDVSEIPDEEAQVDLSGDGGGSASDDGRNISAETPPSLDPKKKPSTMGISFTCNGPKDSIPEFDVALTYARYGSVLQEEEGDVEKDKRHPVIKFQRHPRGILLTPIDIKKCLVGGRVSRGKILLKEDGVRPDATLSVATDEDEIESRLTIIIRRDVTDSVWVVTLMLDSQIPPHEGEYDKIEITKRLIFQPSIRVNLHNNLELCERPRRTESHDNILDEDEIDDMLYEGRKEVARGHLCSAVWNGIDPQQIDVNERKKLHIELKDESGNRDVDFSCSPPFYWEDGEHPAFKGKMALFDCDVRTEYIPILDLPSPDMDPRPKAVSDWDDQLVMRPKTLGSAFDAASIKSELQPLVDGYEEWIKLRFNGADPRLNGLRSEAEDCLVRMQQGIDALCNDDDIRLAFNIANQAINLTHEWRHNRDFKWRKFQIAFALSCLESCANPGSAERQRLDLLWVATGGGKTEAYLLLTAFVLALRRIRGRGNGENWFGVDVVTRYTLRLLTIQQFRRALGVITAIEHLRSGALHLPDSEGNDILGNQPFGIGIWVGGGVTHNHLSEINVDDIPAVRRELRQRSRGNNPGGYFDLQRDVKALEHLIAGDQLRPEQSQASAEAAQILNCPCCTQPLAIMRSQEPGQTWGKAPWKKGPVHRLHLLIDTDIDDASLDATIGALSSVNSLKITPHHSTFKTLSVETTDVDYEEQAVESFWKDLVRNCSGLGRLSLVPARASRPGYFLRTFRYNHGRRERVKAYDFQINCPDPECPLNKREWRGELPAGSINNRVPTIDRPDTTGFGIEVPEGLQACRGSEFIGRGMPIPAYTVDEQIYGKCPSLIISTVDKFARMPFDARTGNLFGNVTHHSEMIGFQRGGAGGKSAGPDELIRPNTRTVRIERLPAPTMIIQDELHLIEGPLGSMVGFYETVIDRLMSEGLSRDSDEFECRFRPKYIASTATIRKAEDQVQCLFDRRLNLFPPKGPSWDDRGLIVEQTSEGANSTGDSSGRLYMGISPIGVSAQGLQRNLFSRMLHCGELLRTTFAGGADRKDDRYWSVTGYYNAIRELAGARSIVEQDTNARLLTLGSGRSADSLVELSGRMQSTELPIVLDRLENRRCGDSGSIDTLLTTSMFGTGVDVNRLNLMLVAGQPKSTAQYIQATGRVGRANGAIVSTYLRASRPRDLDHYERFMGYHLQLYRNVEPVTVRPYSDTVLDRAGGPLMVAWMRLSERTQGPWQVSTEADQIASPTTDPDLTNVRKILIARNGQQPLLRQIRYSPPNALDDLLRGLQQDWIGVRDDSIGHLEANDYLRWANGGRGNNAFVVLGNVTNVKHPVRYRAAYSENHATPNSLRTVDSTTAVQERGL
jgi:hypothetical protein